MPVRKPSDSGSSQPRLSPSKGVVLLRQQSEKGRSLIVNGWVHPDKLQPWVMATRTAVAACFGEPSRQVSRFVASTNFVRHEPRHPYRDAAHDGNEAASLHQYLVALDGFVDELQIMESLQESAPPLPPVEGADADKLSTKVFLVHGRDDGTKHTVARFVETLVGHGNVIILHEHPSAGQTIIEKFEKHSRVAFAVVLLTPDDVGCLRQEAQAASSHAELQNALKPRARQNVIMELGFFLAKLGRSKVCVVVLGNVEKPSDYDGVVFVPMDSEGAWRFLLAQEMRSAGLPIDLNRLGQIR